MKNYEGKSDWKIGINDYFIKLTNFVFTGKDRIYIFSNFHNRMHNEGYSVWFYDASRCLFEEWMEFVRFYNRSYRVRRN